MNDIKYTECKELIINKYIPDLKLYTNLTKLVFYNTNILNDIKFLTNLKELEIVSFNYNNLKLIPSIIECLKNLEYLLILDNIVIISNSILVLNKLKFLNLSNN